VTLQNQRNSLNSNLTPTRSSKNSRWWSIRLGELHHNNDQFDLAILKFIVEEEALRVVQTYCPVVRPT
jgi:hypothetical protein